MSALIDKEIKKQQATDVPGGKFTGAGRSEAVTVFADGDHLFIEEDAAPKNVPIRGRKNDDGSQATFEGVYGTITRKVGGKKKELAIAVSPGIFYRNFAVVDKDSGEPTGERAASDGEAVKAFYSGSDLDDQMRKVMGRELVITKVHHAYSYNPDFGMKKPRSQAYYTIDFAE